MHDKGPAVTCMAQQGKVHNVSNSMLIGCVLCRVGRVTRTTTAAPPKCSLRCAHLLCITTSFKPIMFTPLLYIHVEESLHTERCLAVTMALTTYPYWTSSCEYFIRPACLQFHCIRALCTVWHVKPAAALLMRTASCASCRWAAMTCGTTRQTARSTRTAPATARTTRAARTPAH